MNTSVFSLIGRFNEKKNSLKHKKSSATLSVKSIISKDTPFSIIEAYKTARTNILFTFSNADTCKRIVFTSAEPGEGKTTTSINMAITFAQTGAKVLLIDGDLRKPRIHRYLGLEKSNGLSELLVGLIDEKTAINHVEDKGIDCITSGTIPPNPIELLSTDKMELLLDKLSKEYDFIFIDSPPITVVADATTMAKIVDGYIVVVRHNYTIHELLGKARDNLHFAEAKVLGYIMNDLQPMAGIGYGRYGSYGRGYRYKYKYKYGYKYGYGYGYGYSYGDSASRNSYAYADDEDEEYDNE